MDFITALWLPILLSAVAVWIISAVIWMALPHHRKDFDKLPDERGFMDTVKSMAIPAGSYGFPYFGSHKECGSDEAKRMWKEGPCGMLHVWRGDVSMARNMILTFLIYLVIGTVIAYLGWSALPHGGAPQVGGVELPGPGGPSFAKVMQVMGTAGVLTYCFSFLPHGIWFQDKPRALAMNVIDGVVYGLATGAIFAWLWPR